MKEFRSGAIGAILDNYEEVIADLKKIIESWPELSLTTIVFPESNNGCESVQAILSHVVHSAFGYATSIHNSKGNQLVRPEKRFYLTTGEYLTDLDAVFTFTENILTTFNDDELEQFIPALKITTNWGQLYDIEQLMEHAICHILRHRRQLERIRYSANF